MVSITNGHLLIYDWLIWYSKGSKKRSLDKQHVIENICKLVCLWNVGTFAIYSFANQ